MVVPCAISAAKSAGAVCPRPRSTAASLRHRAQQPSRWKIERLAITGSRAAWPGALRQRASVRVSSSSGEAEAEAGAASAPPCEPGKTTLGFVGMGIMGVPMALNLINAGYEVVVWNRTPEKCEPLVGAGARQAETPAEVARMSDVTFGMLSTPFAAYSTACREDSIMEGISPGKGYIDVSTVDPLTSQRVAMGIRAAGGQFLEAPVSGSKGPAEQGQLIFLGAGDEELFERVQHPLEVMGKASFYLGEAGAGANMKIAVNMVMGSMMASFSEGLVLAKRAGLSQRDFLEVVSLGAISSPMFSLKGPAMVEGSFPPAFPLRHQEKDLYLAADLSQELEVKLPLADAALLQYRKGSDLGFGDEDFSAVLKVAELDDGNLMARLWSLEADGGEEDAPAEKEEEDKQ